MRCDEVVRELSAPTADRDRAALAGHLAGCPACTDWARRAAGLDRLWEATRPAEPSPAAWDAVWAKIAATLPCPEVVHPDRDESSAHELSPSRNGTGPRILVHPVPAPAGPPRRGRSWRLAAVALVGLAQAAAILVALGLAWQPIERPDAPPEGAPIVAGDPQPIRWESAVTFNVDVPEGRIVVIHAEETRGLTEDATPRDMNSSADIGLLILNVMESADSPQVAAR